jgi:hypothetical protein
LGKVSIIGPSKMNLVKRPTYYPVPSNVKVRKEQGKIMITFVHAKRAANHDHYFMSARLALTVSTSCII